MSQYTHVAPTGETVVYGHDYALGYFVGVYQDFDEDLVVELATAFGASKDDIIDEMTKYDVDTRHIDLVSMDWPI